MNDSSCTRRGGAGAAWSDVNKGEESERRVL